jgi:DNA-binding LacI/PurR family transcriptional regulator
VKRFKPEAPVPTIRDVARLAKVSPATVSHVLNNTAPSSEETRQRVLAAVAKLGYHPSVLARGLQAGRSHMLGYSWVPMPPDNFTPILDRFLQSMAEAAARCNYHILAFPAPNPHEEIEVYRRMVASGRVDGFILSATNLDDARIQYLLDQDFPFVAFGRANPEWDFPCVDVDGTAGLRMAVEHLVALGHRRISCLAWPEGSLTGQYRLQGYYDGLAAAGLPVERRWVCRLENDYTQAYACASEHLALPPAQRPTAVVCMTDLMALGVLNAAADAGVQVGRDLAVTGFDDSVMARYVRPPLTSLRQPIAAIGERVVQLLLAVVNKETPVERHVVLAPELIVRESTQPST